MLAINRGWASFLNYGPKLLQFSTGGPNDWPTTHVKLSTETIIIIGCLYNDSKDRKVTRTNQSFLTLVSERGIAH